jgi:hypothetical protein
MTPAGVVPCAAIAASKIASCKANQRITGYFRQDIARHRLLEKNELTRKKQRRRSLSEHVMYVEYCQA